MHITERFLAFTLLGAEWVLWLLIALSVVSFAIMIERACYFLTHAVDVDVARRRPAPPARPRATSPTRARGSRAGDSAEMAVDAPPASTRSSAASTRSPRRWSGAKARERMRLERNLAFLGTLGNNAPFIGLFGTVLGIIKAFHDLSGNQAGGVAVVMAGISEALVATAVGLMVAIPAVVGFNFFNRRVRADARQRRRAGARGARAAQGRRRRRRSRPKLAEAK